MCYHGLLDRVCSAEYEMVEEETAADESLLSYEEWAVWMNWLHEQWNSSLDDDDDSSVVIVV